MRVVALLAAIGARRRRGVASRTPRPARCRRRTRRSSPGTATYEEQIGEQVARRLTGHACPCAAVRSATSSPNVLGVTPLRAGGPVDYFLMRPAECTYLSWFRRSPARWDPRSCSGEDCMLVPKIAMALAVVAHESYHILGYRNEAQVECYGLQSIWFVANKLGAPVAEAQAVASFYATRMYPLRRTTTPAYWSAQCRDGGRYDLRRTLARWPS